MTPAAFHERGWWWLRRGEKGEERSSSRSSQLNTTPHGMSLPTPSTPDPDLEADVLPSTPYNLLSAPSPLRKGRRGSETLSHHHNSSEINQILTIPWVPNPDLCIGLFKSIYNFIMDALMQKLSEKKNTQGIVNKCTNLLTMYIFS